MTAPMSPEHRARSKRVAERLAEVLHDAHAQPHEVQHIDDLGWRVIVLCAAERTEDDDGFKSWEPEVGYTPSLETRERVAKLLRPPRKPPADPFDGLPS